MVDQSTPRPETPAEFVARLGVGADKAWRLWNENPERAMSREAFRKATRQ